MSFTSPGFSLINYRADVMTGVGVCGNCGRKLMSRMDTICESCSNLNCTSCGYRYYQHNAGIQCPESEVKKQQDKWNAERNSKANADKRRDLAKNLVLQWAKSFSPSRFIGILTGLQNYNTSQIRNLGGLYTATFSMAGAEMLGQPGFISVANIDQMAANLVNEIPGFKNMGSFGQRYVGLTALYSDTAQAKNLTNEILSNPNHAVWQAQELIEYNESTITWSNFIKGLAWNSEWLPGVTKSSKRKPVTIERGPNTDNVASSPNLFTLQPGQYKSFEATAKPIGNGRNHVMGIYFGKNGWQLRYPQGSNTPTTIITLTDVNSGSEAISSFTSGENYLHIRYDLTGSLHLRINGKDVGPGLKFNNRLNPQTFHTGVAGLEATFGKK